MSKKKSITLLTIVSIIMAFILVMTFIRFPMGVKEYQSALGAIELDYDLEGGVAYTMTLASDNEEEVENVDDVIRILKGRVEALGYNVYSIKAVKSTDEAVLDQDIRLELKKTETVDEDVKVIAAYGEVEFFGGSESNPSTQILEDLDVVADSQYLGLYEEGNYAISIVFNAEAKDALVKAIEENESGSYYLKITCGADEHGNENVLFNATITADAFQGNMLGITGIGSEEMAKRLALQMRSGGLAYKYDLSDGEVIDSPYGTDVALKCAVSIMTLILVLMIVYIVFYRGLGVITSLATLLFILFETWLMIGVPGIIVSMGGIFGIICATIACAVGMVMLAQTVKDEYANSEKTVKAAVAKGFKVSLVPTIMYHVIAGAVALLLLAFTSGTLKCFAITFGIGIAVSLISTLVFTRMFTSLILPIVKNKEKFLRFKRAEKTDVEIDAEV